MKVAMTYFDRIKNALLELFVFLPLSAIIFVLVWFPIFSLVGFATGGESLGPEVWIMLPIIAIVCYGIAILISKLRMKARGYQVDLTHSSFWNSEYRDAYGNSHFTSDGDTPTVAGVASVLLSFIALPLGIVAVIASLLGLIYPSICSTPGPIETSEHTRANQVLHGLFDFVIAPTGLERPRNPSLLGIVNLLSPILTVGVILASLWIVSTHGQLIVMPEIVQFLLLFISLLVVITLIVSAIIDTVLLCRAFTLEQAKDNLERAVILIVLFALAFVPMALSM